MRTTPCFIRKNTEELQKKLEKLGYIKNSPAWTDNCHIIWAYQYSQEKGFDIPHYVIANAFDIPFDKHSLLCGKFIDCGVEEDLFLAIAALRIDTDKFQWFTDGYHWEKCPDEVACIRAWIDKYKCTPHKATVEELIEHFNMKNIQK